MQGVKLSAVHVRKPATGGNIINGRFIARAYILQERRNAAFAFPPESWSMDGSSAVERATAAAAGPGRPGRRIPLTAGLLGFVALIVVPLVVMLYLGLSTARENTFDLLHDQTAHFMASLTERIGGQLDPVAVQSDYVAAMIAGGELDPADSKRLGQALVAAMAALPQVRGLAFIDADGHTVRARRSERRAADLDWSDDRSTKRILAEAQNAAGSYWGEFFFAESTATTLLNHRTPVRRNGQFLGVLIASVSTASLSEFLAHNPFGPQMNAFILAGGDSVIAHSRLTGPVSGLSDQQPLPRLDQVGDPILQRAAADGKLVLSSVPAPLSTIDTVQDADGAAYLLVYQTIDKYGAKPWVAGLHLPRSLIERALMRIDVMAAIGLVILLATVLAAYLLGRALTRPVREIAAAATRIHDFEVEAGRPLGVSHFRELDDAARAFNAMLAGLSGFQTYLPKSLVRRLMQRGHIANVLSEEREVTVLFTDISNFTGFSENLPADGVAAFLNRHFTLLVKCVEEEGGTVDKYVGDSLMAFWGAPDNQPDHAERAFGAALNMALAIKRENAARQAAGLEPIRIRIGLHSGSAVVGNIGAPGRVNYTVVGDTVNVARRMESLSKSLAWDRQEAIILVSSFTIQHLGLGLESFSIGAHSLKGRDGPIEVFRLA